ncbi:MAG TPA: NUDIX domain-containing protein [Saprospiraceae bacterium]|nr:NUDIX domain-containing protein [Saprospiraceae bacterium]
MVFPKGYKKSAAMIVLRHEDQFMLLKRAKPPHRGKYVPVGGKLEPYEDPYTAAKRELQEETGLMIDHLHYCGVLIETAPVDYNWQCNIYLADIDFMSPPFCDEGELEWISFTEVKHIPTPPTDWQIYQYIMQQRPFALNAVYDQELNLVSMVEEIQQEKLI